MRNETELQSAFTTEPLSKRRRGYPSETNVGRGVRTVGEAGKTLEERLGRNGPVPLRERGALSNGAACARAATTAPCAPTTFRE